MNLIIDDKLDLPLKIQYENLRSCYSEKIEISPFETIYDIRKELGNGFIKTYELKKGLSIVIYDLIFNKNLVTLYDLSDKYFEIEYCISGSMDIWEEKKDKVSFIEGELSISKDKPLKGKVIYNKNIPYKGVSIAGDTKGIADYFGSVGKDFWNETIGSLDKETRDEYYRGKKISPDISNIFIDISSVNMPYKGKIIYIESKVMELLSMLASYEIKEDLDDVILDDYEREKIKKIPSILMDNIFSPPTIEELSKILSINRNKLNEGFKLIYKDTIYNHHRTMCLERSKMFLKNTNKSIANIALDIGYSSSSNYIYAFKRKYQITPNEYRKKEKKFS